MNATSVADLRRDYVRAGLAEADAGTDPVRLFALWFDQALLAGVPEPNAMTLATATPDGRPSARVVLLKRFDDHGFCFFTNYDGRKALELANNPHAALVFFWAELERQVRIEGVAAPTSEAESDEYFASRPRGSRLGAWASPQSAAIPDRADLEARLRAVEARFADADIIPRPPNWGGFRLVPGALEFWQGRPSRLHDRIRFVRTPDGWFRERLAP